MPHLPFHTPHHIRRRVAVVAAATAGLALVAALTACTSAATSTLHPAAADVTDMAGAGSTFDAPFFNLAFPAYQQAHLSTGISYDADGSSAGITRFTAGQVNFGATDVPLARLTWPAPAVARLSRSRLTSAPSPSPSTSRASTAPRCD
jgi:ABC-type phosphate transport system substrate-binding protein